MPNNNIGRLGFEFETFKFGSDKSRQRPVKVFGTLSSFASIPADPPLSHFEGGDTSASVDAMEGYDKGHVIMVSHSGVSNPENIVPMYPCFNQAGGIWRELEYRIASYTKLTMPSRGSARVMEMTVEIKYEGTTDPRFPTAFLVTVKDNSAQGGYVYFNNLALDRLRFNHLPTPPVKIDALKELGGEVAQLIIDADEHVRSAKWTVESLYKTDDQPNLASLSDVPSRPYAMLDYLWLVKRDARILERLTDGCVYRHRHAAEFHERQKMLIRICNAMYHKGLIKSDYPGDTTESLILGSGQRSAQIDHVFPYSEYGGNLFSNALVASGAYNNRMKATSPKAKWKDKGGAKLYDTDRHL